MNRKPYYVTTPIYYVNDVPHIGHTYTTVAADILSRYHRLLGEESFFLTGTDENAKSSEESARKNNEDVQDYVDRMSGTWEETWKELGLSHDFFIRTTSGNHKKGVLEFFKRVYDQGDIYKGEYEGLYCEGCEEFKTERDLNEEGCCPQHKKPPKKIKEENYFFKLSKYREALLEHYEKNPSFIEPEFRANEVKNYVKNHMEDVSISRQGLTWGIPFPIDETHRIYVWFDALINYLTGVGFGWNEKMFEKYWPADVHLMAKDIIKFHCALWPAMLMSAGLELPKKIFAHGFFTIEGEKISKSLGNAINPLDLKAGFGFDPVRYYLFAEIPFGADGNFSREQLLERYNSQLANGIGNLVARTAKLCERTGAEFPTQDVEFGVNVAPGYHQALNRLAFQEALAFIWKEIAGLDKTISEGRIWEKNDEDLTESLKPIVDEIRLIATLLSPFLPETAQKIQDQFQGLKILSSTPLFPRK